MSSVATAIPSNFGTGGSGLAPGGNQGTPSLKDILVLLKNAANDAPARWQKSAADGAAGDATAEVTFFEAAAPQKVTGIGFDPAAALTAHNTTNATITIARRDADGTNKTTVATITTNVASGDWVAFVKKALVLSATAANLVLAVGQKLTVEITKGSTGVVVPAGALFVQTQALAA